MKYKIEASIAQRAQLAKTFGTSTRNVVYALNYERNSDLAMRIRQAALAMGCEKYEIEITVRKTRWILQLVLSRCWMRKGMLHGLSMNNTIGIYHVKIKLEEKASPQKENPQVDKAGCPFYKGHPRVYKENRRS